MIGLKCRQTTDDISPRRWWGKCVCMCVCVCMWIGNVRLHMSLCCLTLSWWGGKCLKLLLIRTFMKGCLRKLSMCSCCFTLSESHLQSCLIWLSWKVMRLLMFVMSLSKLTSCSKYQPLIVDYTEVIQEFWMRNSEQFTLCKWTISSYTEYDFTYICYTGIFTDIHN